MQKTFLDKGKICLGLLVVGISTGISGLQSIRLNRFLIDNVEDSLPTSVIISQDQALKSNLELLNQVPSFGYENIVSNFVYLNFLQYFGNRISGDRGSYTANPLFFANILDRDPFFIRAYWFLSSSVSIYSGRPDISVGLIEQGLSYMTPDLPPDSYYLWRYKALDELLFLGAGETARQSYLKAAEWASLSPDESGDIIAERSLNTAQFLAQDVNSKPAQISAWAQVLAGAIDEQTRQIAIENIENLGGIITTNQNGQVTVQYQIEPDTDSLPVGASQ